MVSITTATAIWGAITGSLSLAWNIYSKKLEKPHLKVRLSDRYCSLIGPPDRIKIKYESNDKFPFIAICVRISNTGNQPETIYGIKFYSQEYKRWIPVRLTDFYLESNYKKISENESIEYPFPVSKKINLPFEIKGHQTVERKFFVLVNKSYLKSNIFKFKFETTDKIYRKAFRISHI
ncbi:MAG TPA: hypothetical protein K8W06_04750 [Limosilactobacillus coleohominis]|nr:hypothetical protein [Limosilactobacillus coleohominis]